MMLAHRPARGALRGTAMLMTLVLIVTIALFSLGVLQVSASFTRRQMLAVHDMRAFYLAEAALSESYVSLSEGSTGQIGSMQAPAALGNGLVWVDSTWLGDNLLRLEGTAMSGSGRSTLALTVRRVEQSVGLFSAAPLQVGPSILVDGYDSGEGPYEDQASASWSSLERMDLATFAQQWMGGVQPDDIPLGVVLELPGDRSLPTTCRQYVYRDSDWAYFRAVELLADGSPDVELETEVVTVTGGDAGQLSAAPESPGTTTGRDGLLGSNGDVVFGARRAWVFGDVNPGPGGVVSAGGGVVVTGLRTARAELVELDAVEVPDTPLENGVAHSGALPLVLAPASLGFESLDVGRGSEVVVTGPATLVLGSLSLADGALLRVENDGAPVRIVVLRSVSVAAGAALEVASPLPGELSLEIAGDAGPVELLGESAFRGTVYAPAAPVHVGRDFELFGALIAGSLELDDGARLHFDQGLGDGAGSLRLPRMISWEIAEIPAAVRRRTPDPHALAGIAPADVLDVHSAKVRASWTARIFARMNTATLLEYEGPYEDFEEYADVDTYGKFVLIPPDVDYATPWTVNMVYQPVGSSVRTTYRGPLSGVPTDQVEVLYERVVIPPSELLAQGWGPIVYKK